jgi:hypothetical protein
VLKHFACLIEIKPPKKSVSRPKGRKKVKQMTQDIQAWGEKGKRLD